MASLLELCISSALEDDYAFECPAPIFLLSSVEEARVLNRCQKEKGVSDATTTLRSWLFMTSAGQITALIPTFRRVELLERTVGALLAGSLCPSDILVSDGSGDPSSRHALEKLAERYPIRLASQPVLGTISGNRNNLLRNCTAEFALLVDDDTEVHPQFLERALDLLLAGTFDIVCAQVEHRNVESWFTFRGYWRERRPKEPTAVTPTTMVARSDLLRQYPFDEHLVYGYEEADLSMRLASYRTRILTALPSVDLARGQTVNMDATSKSQAADSSRLYVMLKNHWGERARVALLFAVVLLINLARRKAPLPRSLVARQWSILGKCWIRGEAWPWPEELPLNA